MTPAEMEAAIRTLQNEFLQLRRVLRRVSEELQARNPRVHEKIDWEDF